MHRHHLCLFCEGLLTLACISTGISNPTDNQTIYITVSDVNDNRPVFQPNVYNVSMPEEISVGGLVTDVTASDPDVGDNARLVFAVDGSPDAAFFYFDSIFATQSGALKMQTVRTAIV